MSPIGERVVKIIARELGMDPEQVAYGDTFGGSLDCDSLDFINALVAIDIEFGVRIESKDAAAIKSVADLVRHVEGARVAA